MLFAVTLLVLVALSVPVLVVMALRRWGLETAETERRLSSPQTPTVSYVVPEGQDPVFVRAALAHAGFDTMLHRSDCQRLIVGCAAGERDRVRETIENVERTGLDDREMPAGRVHFQDDPTQPPTTAT